MKINKWNCISIGLSILAVSFSLLKVTPFEVTSETYIGTTITLLALATTFVIGYQIYNAIELKKELAEQKEMYNTIVQKNKEISVKLIEQDNCMNEGFDILSSLTKYNSGQDFVVCAEAFYSLHHALLYSINTSRTDYAMIFYYLRRYITNFEWQSFCGSYSKVNDRYIVSTVNDYGKSFEDIINEYLVPIKEDEEKLRNNANFIKIQYEYNRIMNIFYNLMNEMIKNPAYVFSFEEKQNILYPKY